MCGCECCISAEIIHSSLLSWRDHYLRKLNDLSQNVQNRRSGEKPNRLFETYKNYVIPHGCHIYATESDMAMTTICAYPPSQHALPHWKYVLRCFYNITSICLPDQESDKHYSNISSSIRFHIYDLITQCTVNGRHPLFEKKICPDTVTPAKLYTRKDIDMMETSIADFHTSFYIPAIQKLAFHLPHAHIIGTNHLGNTRREAFKRLSSNQYLLCRLGYAERVETSFAHQIQSE